MSHAPPRWGVSARLVPILSNQLVSECWPGKTNKNVTTLSGGSLGSCVHCRCCVSARLCSVMFCNVMNSNAA